MLGAVSMINWWAVAAAFAVYFALGALWFVVLFNKQYNRSLGRQDSAEIGKSPTFIVGPAVCTLLTVIATAFLIKALGISTLAESVGFGLLVGLGYLASNTVNTAINPLFPRPFHYGLVSGAYHLTGVLLASVILVAIG